MKKIINFLLNLLGYKAIGIEHFEILKRKENVLFDIMQNFSFVDKEKSPYQFLVGLSDSNEYTCFDIGANIGQTAKKIKSAIENSIVYCFEPIKSTFDELVVNTGSLENVKTFNFAMGTINEEKLIYHQENSEWNSFNNSLNNEAKKRGAQSETVKVTSVDSFIETNNIEKIHLLKSDTEGFELEVIKGASKSLSNKGIDAIYIEVGFRLRDPQHNYWLDVIDELDKYNYKFYGLYEVVGNEDEIGIANALFLPK